MPTEPKFGRPSNTLLTIVTSIRKPNRIYGNLTAWQNADRLEGRRHFGGQKVKMPDYIRKKLRSWRTGMVESEQKTHGKNSEECVRLGPMR